VVGDGSGAADDGRDHRRESQSDEPPSRIHGSRIGRARLQLERAAGRFHVRPAVPSLWGRMGDPTASCLTSLESHAALLISMSHSSSWFRRRSIYADRGAGTPERADPPTVWGRRRASARQPAQDDGRDASRSAMIRDCWASLRMTRSQSKGDGMFRRGAQCAVSLASAVVSLSAGPALAAPGGPNGTVTETVHEHNVVLFSEASPNPCTGEPGTFTATAANGVFHATFFENSDEFWVTATYEGTATFTPDNPEGVSASGHFAVWFGAAGNEKNEVETNTNTFNLKGSDGSHIVVHGTAHVATNGSGAVTVNFEKNSVHCG
jgi:hypothetical protein